MSKNIDEYRMLNSADNIANALEPGEFKVHRFCVAPMLDWTL